MYKSWMCDIETLGKRPGCVVLSIAAVPFNHFTDSIGTPLYAVVDAKPQLAAGLDIDGGTLEWWCGQGKSAQNILSSAFSKPACTLQGFMQDWRKAAKEYASLDDVRVWGNGAGFDQPIITAALEKMGAGDLVFWKFYNDQCYRTLKSLSKMLELKYPDLPKPDEAHNALSDAHAQARGAIITLRRMAGLPFSKYDPEHADNLPKPGDDAAPCSSEPTIPPSADNAGVAV